MMQPPNQEPEQCAICLEYFNPSLSPEDKAQTICNHFFHKTCLDDWLRLRSTCPMCRKFFPPDTLAHFPIERINLLWSELFNEPNPIEPIQRLIIMLSTGQIDGKEADHKERPSQEIAEALINGAQITLNHDPSLISLFFSVLKNPPERIRRAHYRTKEHISTFLIDSITRRNAKSVVYLLLEMSKFSTLLRHTFFLSGRFLILNAEDRRFLDTEVREQLHSIVINLDEEKKQITLQLLNKLIAPTP